MEHQPALTGAKAIEERRLSHVQLFWTRAMRITTATKRTPER